MPRIDEMPEYRARLRRTTHDLSHKFGFTATVAHLMPVFHDFLQAGETIELSFNYTLRTQPLQSAAMVDIKSHVEYFFVPANLLYEPFGNMFYNLNDNYSSNFPNDDSYAVVQPALPVLDFSDFNTQMQAYDTTQVGEEDWLNHCFRLFDLLGYNNYHMNQNDAAAWNPNVFPYPILAYNCIYEYYYRLDNRERFDQRRFNWDKFYNTPVVDNNNGLNMLDWIRLYYRPKDSDYFTDVKVSPIVDVLNLNSKTTLAQADSWLSRGQILDYSGTVNEVLGPGTVGSPTSSYGDFSGVRANPSNNIVTKFGYGGDRVNALASGGSQLVAPNGFDINTANIRALFANEKLNSITGRARKHYDDQVLAHLGFKVPHDVKHEISCFGHDRGLIHIGEVISTADTANAGLGEIAGKGYGSLETKPHKFTAPCHGVVMAILSFVPDVTYGFTYCKHNAVVDRNSFYNPEFDSLGMQPLFGYEGDPTDGTNRYNIMGWQYRFEQWKRRFNRVTKAFAGVGNLDSWMLDFTTPRTTNAPNSDNESSYLHSPSELNQIMLVNYISMAVSGDETHIYDGDPFVVNGFINCKKVSTMSDFSLPRLDA